MPKPLTAYNPPPIIDTSNTPPTVRRGGSNLENTMVRQFISALVIATLLVSTGCGVQRPQLAHPGPMVHQQHYATLHDPYPDTEAGPEVVGGRPLSYMKQLPEAVRSRHLVDSWWSGF